MYFVPDGTKLCGFYECVKCKMRFLDVRVAPITGGDYEWI